MEPHNPSRSGFSSVRALASKSHKAFASKLKAQFPNTKTRLLALFAFVALMCAAFYSTSSASPLGMLLRAYVSGHAPAAKTGVAKPAPTAVRKTLPAASAKPQQTANEPIVESGNLNIERHGHTATKLARGRVLIVGGENEGGLVKKSEIFDPGSRQFSLAARLKAPRTEHTATTLADGRVLVVGGRGVDGSLASSEIFDPATELFSRGSSLNLARAGHTATSLADGRVLIAGGDAQGSAEIFDPSSNRFSLIETHLGSPRSSHSAVLLKSGKVLIAGGVAEDGSGVQAGEIFDPEMMQFSTTRNMRGVRTRPSLRVLPDGKVQVIGGDDDRSMEMFNVEGGYFTAYAHLTPDSNSLLEILRAQTRAALIREVLSGDVKLQALAEPFDELLDRSDHSLTDIPEAGTAVVAGGKKGGKALKSVAIMSSSAATVTTDKTDYAPGDAVIISGTGWQAGETVELRIHRDGTDPSTDTLLSAVADANGDISNSQFVIQSSDLGVSFVLTATGQISGYIAQTTFTDGALKIKSTTWTGSASPRTFGVTVQPFTGSTDCSTGGGATSSATADANGFNTGNIGSGDSWHIVANQFANAPNASFTFDHWDNPDGLTITPSVTSPTICVVGFQSGTKDLVGVYVACTAPTVSCPSPTTVSANANCQAAIPDLTGSATATGNCGPITKTQSPTAGTLVGLGSTTVTITATNSVGQTGTCTTTVTVKDTTAPTFTSCPSNIIASTASGACTAAVPFTVTATDNCPGVTVTCTASGATTGTVTSGSTFNKGVTNVSCTASDASPDSPDATCSFTVTVNDTVTPTFTACPSNITQNTDTGVCTAAVSFTVTAADNCPGVTFTCTASGATTGTVSSGSAFNKGITNVSCTATDTSGNTSASNCSFSVTVKDVEAPTCNLPANIIQGNTTGMCGAVVSYTATASDNCPGATISCSPVSGSSFPVGTTTVNCTASDTSADSPDTNCSFTVTIKDVEAPTCNLPANITQNNDTGACGAVVTYSASASDNCSVATINCSPASGSTFSVGTTTVNCTASDASPDSPDTNCSFTVTVKDVEAPTCNLPADITKDNDPGVCGALVDYTASASDNCPGATIICSPASGSSFPTGTTTVNCTASDASPDSPDTNCSFTVTINDTEKPTFTACPSNINQDTDSGVCTAVVSFTVTAADNCEGVTFSCTASGATTGTVSSGSAFNKGITNVSCTATDASGNTSASPCSFTVTVNDNEKPTFTACPSNITQNTDTGVCTAAVSFTVTAEDNCLGVTFSCTASGATTGTVSSGSTFNKGITNVSCTATDASGKTSASSCSFTVTVNDTENPKITCPSPVSVNNDPGVCGAKVYYTTPVGTDNCPGQTTTQTTGLASGSTFPIGTTTNMFKVTDAAGLTAECSFTVTVIDNEKPKITCPADVTQSTDTRLCTATVNPGTATATDNCPGVTVAGVRSDSQALSAPYPKGATTITWTATDAHSNTASCTQTVTVNDTEPPQITCPPNVTQSNDPGQCSAVVSYADPTASDNCPDVTTSCSPASGSPFPEGTTTVTCTATDKSNNKQTCTFTVTVNDTEKPTFTACPSNISQDTDSGVCTAAVSFTVTAHDNCPGVTFTCTASGATTGTVSSGSTFNKGITNVSCTATDATGNTSDTPCSFTVTVNDNEKPTFSDCQSNIVKSTDSGVCNAALPFTVTAHDNCLGVTFTCTASGATTGTVSSSSTFYKGITTVSCTATDASGKTSASSCSFTVTVNDTENPKITCPSPVSVNNDPGVCGAKVYYTAPVGTDNCPEQTTAQTSGLPSGSTFPVGTTTNTFRVTDAAGLTAECSFTVTVIDAENPKILCPANVSVNNDPGVCGAKVTYAAPVGTDNCSGATTAQTGGLASGAIFPIGTTTNTFKVTDAAGHTAECSFTVTVTDNENPKITCPGNISVNSDPGVCGATVNYTAPVGTDNCSGPTTQQTAGLASGSVFPVGTTTNTFKVADGSGNTATCSFTVTVSDKEYPKITCPGSITVNNDPGMCGAKVYYTAPVGTDNCSGATTAQTAGLASGATFPVGTTTNTFKVTDASSNMATCSFTVTVVDNEAPKITCPGNISIVDNVAGSCGATVPVGTATATDNCGVASVVGTRNDLKLLTALYPVGTTTITWKATDAAGNYSTCVQTVAVTNPAPTLTLTGPASGSIFPVGTPVNFTGTFTDNAGDTHTAQWTLDAISMAGTVNESAHTVSANYAFATAGVYSVQLSITDDCGQTATANLVGDVTAMVVVYDPNAGFVTGGGWINSPAGAYFGNPLLVGKANFGFVSKYKKGQSTPTGETEFQFQVANFNFHSTSYDWLVVAGPKAQYKGSGTINGSGDYAFMLTAIDGQLNGGGGSDKFRIKVWDKTTSAIIYDNLLNAPDSSDPTTVLGGGSIVIHSN